MSVEMFVAIGISFAIGLWVGARMGYSTGRKDEHRRNLAHPLLHRRRK